MRGPSFAAETFDLAAVFLKYLQNASGGIRCLLSRQLNSFQEEPQPLEPIALETDCVEAVVVLLSVLFEEQAEVKQRLGANVSINLPPDQRSLIPDDFVAAAKAFGDEIRKRFANPIAVRNTPSPGDVVELAWATPQEINTIVSMENIANGQKIARYTLEAFVNGDWVALTPTNRFNVKKPYNPNPGFETIGHKKIDRVNPVTTNRIRFRCLKSVQDPVELRSLSVYHCETIK